MSLEGWCQGPARSTQLSHAQGSTRSALLPSLNPTHGFCHQVFGGLHDHRQQNLARVEANKCCLRASERASGTQPHENICIQIPYGIFKDFLQNA